jgi:hypothetical protein
MKTDCFSPVKAWRICSSISKSAPPVFSDLSFLKKYNDTTHPITIMSAGQEKTPPQEAEVS